MDKDRLLTQEEWQDALDLNDRPGDSTCRHCREILLGAQDSKTAAQVEAATLQAVGEAIHKGHKAVISLKPVTYEWHLYEDEIEALRQGKMPAGWEGR